MNQEIALALIALASSGVTSALHTSAARIKARAEGRAEQRVIENATEALEVEKHTSFRADFNQLVDQLQEEQSDLRKRVGQLEHHERIRDDYIIRLRQHISDGLPPPPPEWPEALRTTP